MEALHIIESKDLLRFMEKADPDRKGTVMRVFADKGRVLVYVHGGSLIEGAAPGFSMNLVVRAIGEAMEPVYAASEDSSAGPE